MSMTFGLLDADLKMNAGEVPAATMAKWPPKSGSARNFVGVTVLSLSGSSALGAFGSQ